jgi:glycosyltransferase involved in cell wall biosynthesis
MANRPLHIAMVAPPWYEVPPAAYGGIEQLVGDLVQNLLRTGNEVTLIGAGETGTDAKYLQTLPTAPSDRIGESLPEVVHAALAAKELELLDVDVVHDHSLAGPLTAAARDVPTVVTVHGPVMDELGELYAALGDSVELVAISEAQRSFRPELNWVATVHNAIDVNGFPYQDDKEDYVLFLGRMSHEKGVHLAIDAAMAAGQRLVIAAKCEDDLEKEYFQEYVEPRLGPGAEYVGEASGPGKRDLLRTARCLLLPLLWEEPFGLVMIEALACGTPVVALRRGAAPEIVIDGVTGFVCDEPDELPAALREVDRIDPALCRRDAERRFDLSVMVQGYERVYRDLAASA